MTPYEISAAVEKARQHVANFKGRTFSPGSASDADLFAESLVALADRPVRVPDDSMMKMRIDHATDDGILDREAEAIIVAINTELADRRANDKV